MPERRMMAPFYTERRMIASRVPSVPLDSEFMRAAVAELELGALGGHESGYQLASHAGTLILLDRRGLDESINTHLITGLGLHALRVY